MISTQQIDRRREFGTAVSSMLRTIRGQLDSCIGHARARQAGEVFITLDDAALSDLGLHRSQVKAIAIAAE